MVSNLQFAAVAAYLLWCLFSALTGAVGSEEQAAAQDIDESDKRQQSPSARAHHGVAGRCSRGATPLDTQRFANVRVGGRHART